MSKEIDWRALINSYDIDLPEDGASATKEEEIVPKAPKKRGRKPQARYQVQKIITEVLVYTDINSKTYQAPVFQQLVMYGELTQGKLDRLIANEMQQHETEE